MDMKNLVKQGLGKWGQQVYLKDKDWTSTPFNAFVQSVRYKNKMYLRNDQTDIGIANQDYFLIITPFDHSPAQLSREAIICTENEAFAVVKAENVMMGDDVLYCWSIGKRLLEDDA